MTFFHNNEILQQQILAFQEKEKKWKENELKSADRRKKDREKLREQLKTYESLLDSGIKGVNQL